MQRRVIARVVAIALAAMPASATRADGDAAGTLRSAALAALETNAPAEAARLVEAYLEQAPADAVMLYNAACLQAAMGATPRAERYLLDAVKAGFHDFSHLRRDQDLAGLRSGRVYEAILAARNAADPVLAERRVSWWRDRYAAADYVFEADDERRIHYLTTLPPAQRAALRQRVSRLGDVLAERLFEAPPHQYVLAAIPDAATADRIFPDPNVHGSYHHGKGQIIAADTGRSLLHEIVHAYHHHHMDRLGRTHPMWIQEGFAALFESCRFDDDGSIELLPNERDAIARRLLETDRLLDWPTLFTLTDRRFQSDPGRHYAQARSIMAYFICRGRLDAWYRAYTGGLDEDPTGVRAMEETFERSVAEIESDWRLWLGQRSAGAALVTLRGVPTPPADPEVEARRVALTDAVETFRAVYARGDYAGAIVAAQDVLSLDGGHAATRYYLGLASLRLGDLEEARTQHAILATMDPSLTSLLGNLIAQN